MNSLPDDLLISCFQYLQPSDLLSCGGVSHQWRQANAYSWTYLLEEGQTRDERIQQELDWKQKQSTRVWLLTNYSFATKAAMVATILGTLVLWYLLLDQIVRNQLYIRVPATLIQKLPLEYEYVWNNQTYRGGQRYALSWSVSNNLPTPVSYAYANPYDATQSFLIREYRSLPYILLTVMGCLVSAIPNIVAFFNKDYEIDTILLSPSRQYVKELQQWLYVFDDAYTHPKEYLSRQKQKRFNRLQFVWAHMAYIAPILHSRIQFSEIELSLANDIACLLCLVLVTYLSPGVVCFCNWLETRKWKYVTFAFDKAPCLVLNRTQTMYVLLYPSQPMCVTQCTITLKCFKSTVSVFSRTWETLTDGPQHVFPHPLACSWPNLFLPLSSPCSKDSAWMCTVEVRCKDGSLHSFVTELWVN